jgi:cellulose/xylan binding protein with CBM9 domain
MSLPVYRCQRADEPIEIDGDINKPAWDGVEAVSLVDVVTGDAPDQATSVKMLWDDAYLYFAFHAVDSDIWSTFRKRDEMLSEQEVVEMFIDPFGLGKVYYEFNISPHNVIFDAVVLNKMVPPDGPRDIVGLKEWDCEGLKTAVVVDGELDSRKPVSKHWDAEAAVPFAELVPPHCPPRPGDEWRLNLFRIDRAEGKDEYQAWAPTGRVDYHMPWSFGTLRFE